MIWLLSQKKKIDYFNQEKILNLKNNNFPEDLISLEFGFTGNNAIKEEALKEEPSLRKVQETKKMNIGTIKDPKFINLGDTCSEEETLQYILFRELEDVFTWRYDDLNLRRIFSM